MDDSAGVEVFRSVFFTWLSLGALLALVFLCLGVFRFRIIGQLFCALAATVFLWFGLWYGTHMGYYAWQTLPNHGSDAYADGAALTGTFMESGIEISNSVAPSLTRRQTPASSVSAISTFRSVAPFCSA